MATVQTTNWITNWKSPTRSKLVCKSWKKNTFLSARFIKNDMSKWRVSHVPAKLSAILTMHRTCACYRIILITSWTFFRKSTAPSSHPKCHHISIIRPFPYILLRPRRWVYKSLRRVSKAHNRSQHTFFRNHHTLGRTWYTSSSNWHQHYRTRSGLSWAARPTYRGYLKA